MRDGGWGLFNFFPLQGKENATELVYSAGS